ncbi:MAG TPA: hypothetical protein VL306_03005 [Methylomirabilota bacterium]|jgi:hypothetical protein|nr:hypothetical protein [Methylomirabilota bacterium]
MNLDGYFYLLGMVSMVTWVINNRWRGGLKKWYYGGHLYLQSLALLLFLIGTVSRIEVWLMAISAFLGLMGVLYLTVAGPDTGFTRPVLPGSHRNPKPK